MYKQATIEELWKMLFSVRSMPRLYIWREGYHQLNKKMKNVVDVNEGSHSSELVKYGHESLDIRD
jgi:hypothetical protein